ncbi:AA_TRNA_LIGASE_II domain-containing protein [Meloidogyne graminicola]|uniref:serine--tRNA ligase n=1 Tax=Meloidogyne graminicola TaxID=189291 RepID=A0A8S9ZKJ4_9BILA|nr:AA_TRNA_LIGASE_II domain-containing protein [Meloidogyne graminicola]
MIFSVSAISTWRFFLIPSTSCFISIQKFSINSRRLNIIKEVNSKYDNKIIEYFGGFKREERWLKSAEKLVDGWGVLRWPRHSSGRRNYALIGVLCDLERALLDYANNFIHNKLRLDANIKNIELFHVEDILPITTTRACGVQPTQTGQHPLQYLVYNATDVYNSQNPLISPKIFVFLVRRKWESQICIIKGRIFQEDQLPTYILAESTCFRPEISNGHLECGLYRVHQFKKIEIFVICTEKQSFSELDRIVQIQKDLFSSLGIHCRLLDMCIDELGVSASKKFDIEAWLPGRREWGELSSASNCTDYQAQRLELFYSSDDSSLKHVHTCNGTGIASSRTIIAILESFQSPKRHGFQLPELIKKMLPAVRSHALKCGKAPSIFYCFDDINC